MITRDKTAGHYLFGGTYNGPHVVIGGQHIWVDPTGALRCKSTAPSSATDGRPFAGTPLVPNAQTGTTYGFVLADADRLATFSNSSATTVTIPLNSSVAYPVGTVLNGAQIGAGQVTVTGAVGVTVNGTPGLKARAQYSAWSAIKTATDTWLLVGDLAA